MAEAVGVMEASLTMTAEYLKTREQFGAPIVANQPCSTVRPTSTRTSSMRAAWPCTHDLLSPTRKPAPRRTRHRDVIAAKIITISRLAPSARSRFRCTAASA
ncbi:hypothetical protein [Brevibacterium sp. UCMA 11754]|uniref:hypothetical protein n=1 Tax=Brevibacterium sp. UCMA 11754 TaxID=2749198 RepID=UPI002E208949